MKRCRMCGTNKPLKDYYIRPVAKDGRYATCKTCKLERDRKRYFGTKGTRDGGVTQVHCENCAFLRECKDQVWLKTFTPYCFPSAKYHGLYQDEYRNVCAEA